MARKRNLPDSQLALVNSPPALPSPVLEAVQDTLLASFREVGPALLEQLSRTDPKEYRAWFMMALALAPNSRSGQAMGGNVINVVNAIPRSPLDQAPANFGQ